MPVYLSWEPPAAIYDGFIIYRKTSPFGTGPLPDPLTTLVGAVFYYEDATAADGTEYWYLIEAVRGGSRVAAAEKNIVSVTGTGGAPRGVGGDYSTFIQGTKTYALHTFRRNGFFYSLANLTVDVLLVGGGGGGGARGGGGGGGGGVKVAEGVFVPLGRHAVVVGAGGESGFATGNEQSVKDRRGGQGGTSSFRGETALGGGGGGCGFVFAFRADADPADGAANGGGGANYNHQAGSAPLFKPGVGAQNNPGVGSRTADTSLANYGAGSGGSGAQELGAQNLEERGGNGGAGQIVLGFGADTVFGGGGGGAGQSSALEGLGGAGGGGRGGSVPSGTNPEDESPGVNGLGGGGGGGGYGYQNLYEFYGRGGRGGTGRVVIRYPVLEPAVFPAWVYVGATYVIFGETKTSLHQTAVYVIKG